MSKRLKTLGREIETLRAAFLPQSFSPIGVYKRHVNTQARTRAFLVLCHAELESYIEEWAKDIAQAAEIVWQKNRRISSPLIYLVASLGSKLDISESTVNSNAKDSNQKLDDVILKLFPVYYKIIKENNGIKEKNILKLFDPIGVKWSAFGSTLLPNLNSFGSDRGRHAHYSRRAVQTVLDPLDEYNRVKRIVSDLEQLEQWLLGYRRSVR